MKDGRIATPLQYQDYFSSGCNVYILAYFIDLFQRSFTFSPRAPVCPDLGGLVP